MIDYHIHTRLCKHARGEADEFVEAAIAAGIKEMAFTDHIPLPHQFDLIHRMAYKETDQYCRWVTDLQRRYPEITIRLGIEADYYQGFETYLYRFLNSFDFDVVIMAIHFIRHWPEGNWIYDYDFPGKPLAEIYLDYINTSIKGIQTGLFDIVGHADIIKRPQQPLLSLVPEDIHRLLSEVKLAGMALEINTSGLRKAIGESYPDLSWIPLVSRYNIPLCTCSDAHRPGQVAWGFKNLYIVLQEYQIPWLAAFEKRKMKRYFLNSA